MSKKEFIDILQKKLENYTKKQCEDIINAFIDSVREVLAGGDEVRLTNFGTFKLRKVKAFDGVNPKNGKPVHFGIKSIPCFKFSANFKKSVVSADK